MYKRGGGEEGKEEGKRRRRGGEGGERGEKEGEGQNRCERHSNPPPTLEKTSLMCVTMATCFHLKFITTFMTVALAAASEGMTRRKVGKRRLSDRVILVAV